MPPSGGSYESRGTALATSTRGAPAREAYFRDYAQTVRAVAVAADVPLAFTGVFRSCTAMAAALACGPAASSASAGASYGPGFRNSVDGEH